ncbi:MAG: RNA methyltransferase [Deltaproteobacteria bacterium]|nr:RNA methyltransferase [Deltaproteobacteria bacterium]
MVMPSGAERPSAARRPQLQLLKNVAIVLVAPKYPENIGASSRIAANMGIGQLIVVSPEAPDQERMRKTATHHTGHLLDSMQIFPDLGQALASFTWVVGTSARQGRQRRLLTSPRKMVADLLPKLAANRVALLFGPEDCGLTNEDLRFCNMVTCIPTADFSSLNLAQAVAVICYELYTAALHSQSSGAATGAKLAECRELENMYGQIELTLRKMNFLPATEYAYWMHNIRNFLGRIGLRSREVKFLRGFCRQVMGLVDKTPSSGEGR